ncbi:MAG: MATE family efflux transporter [Acidobacteriota bacterium]
MIRASLIREELRPMLRVAVPVVLAELGWMFMGVVDTVMVGHLGPEAIAASGVSNSLQLGLAIFGIGLLLGLDTLVSQSYGAGRLDECNRWFWHGVTLAAVLAPILMLVSWLLLLLVPRLGFHARVEPLIQDYYGLVFWSGIPLLFYAAFRRYLQAIHAATPVMLALVTANLVNAFGNWVFINGHLGAPAMGVSGSALATIVARTYLAAVLLVAVLWYDARRQTGLLHAPRRVEAERLRRLLALGLPAASTVGLEVGVFAAATALAGQLAPVAAASHQIALNIAALAFMVPLGLASAGAVRVGHAVGATDPPRAAAAGWTALLLGVLVMVAAAVLFLLIPRSLIGLFSLEEDVLALGSSLLFVAAIFQLFDGLQGVATGVLRGLGDTRTPMITNLAGHWVAGLPIGYTLCFPFGYGVIGLWIGLSTGLIIAGAVLVVSWHRQIHAFQQADASADS